MNFVSTRSPVESISFSEAIFRGLAPDGGLYQFETNPYFPNFFASLHQDISFNALSTALSYELLNSEYDKKTIAGIVNDAFDFAPTLHRLDDSTTVLELFHGPSCAFKDYGASFLASVMTRLLRARNEKIIIVTATSGDTGSAVAQAFHDREGIDVVILYPSSRVSPLQEKQLTTLGGNVVAVEVSGSFDDCQRMAKSAFNNPRLAKLPLSSANSINIGRLIPQAFYYVWAWTRMRRKGDFAFIVPSGNFGNITAGLYASSWGMPVSRFIAATNINDVVPQYLKTGVFTPRPSVSTLSNAMDVGNPSNFDRLDCFYKHNIDVFRKHVAAWSANDEDTKKAIEEMYSKFNYLCCPHTATGWHVAKIHQQNHPGLHTVILATAHPGKFIGIVEAATGKTPQLPESLSVLLAKDKISIPLGNTDKDLEFFLLDRFGAS